MDYSPCDLLIENHHISEEKIDIEFLETLRMDYPPLAIVIMSLINNREYFKTLEKLKFDITPSMDEKRIPKPKKYLTRVFGG